MKFQTDIGHRIVPDALQTSTKTVSSSVACAGLCTLNDTYCRASYDKIGKQCQLVAECNPEIEPWQNGVLIRRKDRPESFQVMNKLSRNRNKIYKGYIGCYKDCGTNIERILGNKILKNISDLSSDKCSNLCQGYRYNGLQNARECFCGNNMDTVTFPRVPESECNMTCNGQKSTMCGGRCRISIYYV